MYKEEPQWVGIVREIPVVVAGQEITDALADVVIHDVPLPDTIARAATYKPAPEEERRSNKPRTTEQRLARWKKALGQVRSVSSVCLVSLILVCLTMRVGGGGGHEV